MRVQSTDKMNGDIHSHDDEHVYEHVTEEGGESPYIFGQIY